MSQLLKITVMPDKGHETDLSLDIVHEVTIEKSEDLYKYIADNKIDNILIRSIEVVN